MGEIGSRGKCLIFASFACFADPTALFRLTPSSSQKSENESPAQAHGRRDSEQVAAIPIGREFEAYFRAEGSRQLRQPADAHPRVRFRNRSLRACRRCHATIANIEA